MSANTRGFSLIELLIVVAIILILAAIAIPNLLRSKISANEASAVASVRAITTAQVAYAQTYASLGYADTLTKLGASASGSSVSSNNADLLDWVLGCTSQPCQKSGYNFSITNATGSPIVYSYTVNGTPVALGRTGSRGFCSGTRMNITFDPAGGTSCTQELQ